MYLQPLLLQVEHLCEFSATQHRIAPVYHLLIRCLAATCGVCVMMRKLQQQCAISCSGRCSGAAMQHCLGLQTESSSGWNRHFSALISALAKYCRRLVGHCTCFCKGARLHNICSSGSTSWADREAQADSIWGSEPKGKGSVERLPCVLLHTFQRHSRCERYWCNHRLCTPHQ